MKIGILTQPLRYNYGGILQNFALQTVLKRMGHEPVTLDQTQIESHSWAYWIVAYVRRILLRAMGKWPYPLFSEIETLRVNKKILVNTRAFVNKYIRIQWETKYEKLHNKDFDALIVGSDQVWRPGGVRDIKLYFFSFARNWSGIKRIAYAASFATDEWEFSQEQTEECKKLADLFDAISVREETGVQLCADNLKHDATWVIDPTMLLTPREDAIQAPNGFFDFVRTAFTQKRKTLANSFGRNYDKKKIQATIELLDWPTTIRAEELSPEQFLNFYKAFKGEP